jgi:hypothetical protein
LNILNISQRDMKLRSWPEHQNECQEKNSVFLRQLSPIPIQVGFFETVLDRAKQSQS